MVSEGLLAHQLQQGYCNHCGVAQVLARHGVAFTRVPQEDSSCFAWVEDRRKDFYASVRRVVRRVVGARLDHRR